MPHHTLTNFWRFLSVFHYDLGFWSLSCLFMKQCLPVSFLRWCSKTASKHRKEFPPRPLFNTCESLFLVVIIMYKNVVAWTSSYWMSRVTPPRIFACIALAFEWTCRAATSRLAVSCTKTLAPRLIAFESLTSSHIFLFLSIFFVCTRVFTLFDGVIIKCNIGCVEHGFTIIDRILVWLC